MTGKEVVNFRGIKALGIPYSRAHIWRLMSAAEFPRCFKLVARFNELERI